MLDLRPWRRVHGTGDVFTERGDVSTARGLKRDRAGFEAGQGFLRRMHRHRDVCTTHGRARPSCLPTNMHKECACPPRMPTTVSHARAPHARARCCPPDARITMVCACDWRIPTELEKL